MTALDQVFATTGAQSVRRALAVLRVLASGQERGVRLIDVATHAGLNRPTAHRLLRVLMEEGAVEQDPSTRRYLIGGEVSLLGLARTTRFPIRAIAEPHLQNLSQALGDTVFLTIRNGADSVCIDRHLGSFQVKVLSIEVGARRPLGVGVSGLVLLASLPPEEATQLVRLNTRKLQALNLDPAELLTRIGLVRAQGYAYASVGVVPGSRAVAVPVCVTDGHTIAGLSIATITDRMPVSRLGNMVEQMRECARLVGLKVSEQERRKTLRALVRPGESSSTEPRISR